LSRTRRSVRRDAPQSRDRSGGACVGMVPVQRRGVRLPHRARDTGSCFRFRFTCRLRFTFRLRFTCQTATRDRSRAAARGGGFRLPLADEGRGAPQGASFVVVALRCRRARTATKRVASRRTACGGFGRGDRASGPGGSAVRSSGPAAFPRRARPRPASLWRSPRRGARTATPASRVRACEARAQAPHPVPPRKRPREAPLANRTPTAYARLDRRG
jgi:hypothetical protein